MIQFRAKKQFIVKFLFLKTLHISLYFRRLWRELLAKPVILIYRGIGGGVPHSYSSSSLTSPRSAFAFSMILSCCCCGTVS